jgi:hypothetical protein
MIWLAWRQFRLPAAVTIATLAVIAIVLAITGSNLHHVYDIYKTHLATCRAAGGSCDQLTNGFLNHDHHLFQWLGTLLVAIPGVIGVFWGPPLLARELEEGSHRLAWTQSVTRTRWLGTKLALVGVAAMATAGLFSLMVTWWASPIDHVTMDRFSSEIFSERGVTPIGYAAFAFALGVTLGVVIRRTLPAMFVTLVGFVLIRKLMIAFARPHLIGATHLSVPLSAASNVGFNNSPTGGVSFMANGVNVPNALVVSNHLVDKSGHVPASSVLQQFFQTACPQIATPPAGTRGGPVGPSAFNECVARMSVQFHESVAYIPASRYWDLQFAETGAFLVLAIVLVAFCFWWIRNRLS